MASEYVIRPRPGYSVHEAVENPRWENAVVEEHRHGHVVAVYPAVPFVLSSLRPVPPPEYYREEKVGKITLEKVIPDGYFASGVSPFVQAVVSVVSKAGVIEFPELYRGVVDGFRILPDTRASQKMLKALVKWMSGRPSFLTVYKEKGRKFYRAGVSLRLRPPLVKRTEGVNPIDAAVCEFGEAESLFSYPQVRGYLVETLGWLTSDEYLRERVRRLVKEGYLERRGELYLFKRTVDKFL